MISKYVCCEDCDYQETCHQFDAFSGCNKGEVRLVNTQPLLNGREDSSILVEHLNTILESKNNAKLDWTTE